MGNSSKRDSKQFELLEKERQAIELRKAGANLEQIAKALGLSHRAGAFKLLQRAREKWARQNAATTEQLVLESRATIEGMKFAIAQQVREGNLAAIDRAIKLEERMAALMGLDAPKRVDMNLAERELNKALDKLEKSLEPDVFVRVVSVLAGDALGEASDAGKGGRSG